MMSRAEPSKRESAKREVFLFVCRQLRRQLYRFGALIRSFASSFAYNTNANVSVCVCVHVSALPLLVCVAIIILLSLFFPLLRFVLCFYVLNAFVVIAALLLPLLVLPRPSLVSKNSHMYLLLGACVCVRARVYGAANTYVRYACTCTYVCVSSCVCVRT